MKKHEQGPHLQSKSFAVAYNMHNAHAYTDTQVLFVVMSPIMVSFEMQRRVRLGIDMVDCDVCADGKKRTRLAS